MHHTFSGRIKWQVLQSLPSLEFLKKLFSKNIGLNRPPIQNWWFHWMPFAPKMLTLGSVLFNPLLALNYLSSSTSHSSLHRVFPRASPEHKGLLLSPSNAFEFKSFLHWVWRVWKNPQDRGEVFCFVLFRFFQDDRHLLNFREAPVLIVFPVHALLLFAIKEFISGELTLLFREGTCSYLGEDCESQHVEPLKREIKRCWQEGRPGGLGDCLTTCIIRTENNWVTLNYRGEKEPQEFHRGEVDWHLQWAQEEEGPARPEKTTPSLASGFHNWPRFFSLWFDPAIPC